MKIYSIETGFFKLDGGAMFGVVPRIIWEKINAPDDKNLCNWALRCLLIEEGNRLILIDTGIGDKQDEKFFKHYYLHGERNLNGSLSEIGFRPEDVTDVLLTHLHFDHCGGSIIREGQNLVPAFKNAVYWSNSRHWKWATEPNEREKASFLKENILPIMQSGQLKMINASSAPKDDYRLVDFASQIQIGFAYGHTDAMMIPRISYKGTTLLFVTDLFPSLGHIPIPYTMAYDMFPLKSMEEKKAILEEAVEKDWILFFEHDPSIECCNLQRTERGIRARDIFTVGEIQAR
jgi:glyoxylase-like metal-dependent hydrolase (beta-lactamase superfamily II)